MAIYAVFLIAVCFSATSAVHKPCGVGQCKLVPVGQNRARLSRSLEQARQNPTVAFQELASAEGVRLVYFNLEIGNNSVHPLESEERLLAKRWIWAKTIQEPMLRLTDNEYDIYSLGLLTRQKRYMSVQLEEKPLRCLAELNASCQDNVVAEALLGNITNLSPGNRLPQTGSVCTYHKKNSSGQEGWKFLCCSVQNITEGNHTIIRCGLALGNVWFTKPFKGVYFLILCILIVYSPAIPLFFLNFQPERGTGSEFEKEDQELSKFEIPVDDDSPITVSALLRDYIGKLPQIEINFNLKLCFYIFAVFPIFIHLKLAVVFFYNLEYYQEVSRKRHYYCLDDGQLFTFCLDTFVDLGRQWKLTRFGTIVFIFCILMFLGIPFIKPKDLRPGLGQLIIERLEKQRHRVFDFTYFMLELYMCLLKESMMTLSLSGRTGESRGNSLGECLRLFITSESRRRQASRFMCDFLLIVPGFLIGATLGIACILILLIGLFVIFLCFSPLASVLVFLALKLQNRGIVCIMPIFCFPVFLFMYFAFVLMFPLALFVVLTISVAFITHIFLLTVLGLVLNYEFVTPYVVFISVVAANIYLCYSNLQSRYKEVKGMISKHWEEETKDLSWIKCRNNGTIPEKLFWSVCGNEESKYEMQILPLRTEIFFMLRDVALIVSFLFLFFLAILSFETVKEISGLVSTFFVFISGVIPTLIFKRFTKKKQFRGWDKIKIDNKIKEAVRAYVLAKMEKIPFLYEVSEPPTAWV